MLRRPLLISVEALGQARYDEKRRQRANARQLSGVPLLRDFVLDAELYSILPCDLARGDSREDPCRNSGRSAQNQETEIRCDCRAGGPERVLYLRSTARIASSTPRQIDHHYCSCQLKTVRQSNSVTSKHSMNTQEVVSRRLHAIETLLVEEKYLPLADNSLKEFRTSRPRTPVYLSGNRRAPERTANAGDRPFVQWWANQKSGQRAQAFAWIGRRMADPEGRQPKPMCVTIQASGIRLLTKLPKTAGDFPE